jgi:hypothetical protein
MPVDDGKTVRDSLALSESVGNHFWLLLARFGGLLPIRKRRLGQEVAPRKYRRLLGPFAEAIVTASNARY